MKKIIYILLGLISISSLSFSKEKVSMIIKNGTILTINNTKEVIKNGVIIIEDNKIIDIGTSEILNKYQSEKIIDADEGIIMPGMINTHNHLPMIAFRGLGEEGIKNRLFAYFFPLESEKLSRDLIYKATILGTIEMAQSGVTTYADMYYHMDEMAEATKKIGIRGILGETIIKFPVVDAKESYGGLEYAKKFIEKYKNDSLIIPALGPHSAYLVSTEKLIEVKEMAEKYKVPVLIHAAEFEDEAGRLPGKYKNGSTIKYLNEIGLLNKNTLLAHAIYLNDEDLELIKKSEVGISYNAIANAKGATGIARINELQELGVNRIGLGTDGPMSTNYVGLIQGLGYASSMQRIKYNDRTIFTPENVLEMATIGGARALNLDTKIGSLEKGKLADIIIFETKSPNMLPNYEPHATIVWQAHPGNITATIVNGKIIVENKLLKTYDLKKNYKEIKEISEDITIFAKELAKKAKEKN